MKSFSSALRRILPPLALPLLLTACSGSALCVAFCTDQTSTQQSYVQARDECRKLAELKVGLSPDSGETDANLDRNAKNKLVGLFSDCMGPKGWAVPGPPEEKKSAATPLTTPSPAAASGTAPAMLPARTRSPNYSKRAAECAFARQAADSSVVSRKRAEACEIECREARKAAPEAPKPAACP